MALGRSKDDTGKADAAEKKPAKVSTEQDITNIKSVLRRVIKVVEKFTSTDLDGDNKIGWAMWPVLGLLGIGMLIGSLAFAAEKQVYRVFAPEGDDAVFVIEADEGDDDGDELEIIMQADGDAVISVGGTDVMILNTTGQGAKNGSTVAEVQSYGPFNKVTLTCTATPITITDDADVAQYGGVKVYDYPAGLLLNVGCVIDGSVTGYTSLIDTFDGDVAIGTVTATTGATLTGTEANILQSVALTQAVDEVANSDAISIASALTESGARWLDGTTTAVDAFLNFVVDDNGAHGAGTATFTGTIELTYMILGDN